MSRSGVVRAATPARRGGRAVRNPKSVLNETNIPDDNAIQNWINAVPLPNRSADLMAELVAVVDRHLAFLEHRKAAEALELLARVTRKAGPRCLTL
jgi:hypothetical protein